MITRKKDGSLAMQESNSMLYPTIFKLKDKGLRNFTWIGWPGFFPKDDEEREKIVVLLAQQKCLPIWPTKEQILLFSAFYDQHLNPLFHNFKGTDEDDIDDMNQELWRNYCDVNQLYVEKLIEVKKKERDLIWIHDVALLLAPLYLKRADNNANIGFYQHSYFPSSDIYRTFTYRNEIIKSLLCCDLIGFHIFEYARNFSAACRKIFKLDIKSKKGGFMGIEYNGRTILIKVNHIGINQEDIYQMLRSQKFFNFKYQLS
jgi:trehalose 6-phosphate synthase/phosphatase